jgi:hypothetical protein
VSAAAHVKLCLVALHISPPIMAKLKTDPTNNERAKKKKKIIVKIKGGNKETNSS